MTFLFIKLGEFEITLTVYSDFEVFAAFKRVIQLYFALSFKIPVGQFQL